ncbi:MAG: hypothetical protein PW734_02675 [Verrucomicrobium sp.]|nr:hypothetical protein [Verrucomicrobium sp.]
MRSLLLTLLLAVPALLHADEITFSAATTSPGQTDHIAVGLHVNVPNLGNLTLEMPQLIPSGQGDWIRPSLGKLECDDTTATVPYSNGAKFTYKIEADHSILCTYSGIPAGFKSLWFSMVLPGAFSTGGQYGFGGADALKPFPATPGNRHVLENQASPFLLVSPAGGGVRIEAPSESFGFNDFRPGWNAFSLTFSYLFKDNPEKGSFTLRFLPLSAPASAPAAAPAPAAEKAPEAAAPPAGTP